MKETPIIFRLEFEVKKDNPDIIKIMEKFIELWKLVNKKSEIQGANNE